MPWKLIPNGTRRGKLVLLRRDPSGTPRRPIFHVKCDCGKEYTIAGSAFAAGHACKKCGNATRDNKKYGSKSIAGDKLYTIWAGMRHRCNPEATSKRNVHWAGRGIRVCEEWNDFKVFRAWALGTGYVSGLSIDRINNDGNYRPDNCEWVTRSENSKRVRKYHVNVRKSSRQSFYDEPCYGDF